MSDEHKQAIEDNIKVFGRAGFADEYDKREVTQFLSLLFVKMLLSYDALAPRKTLEESKPVIGNPERPNSGFSKENLPSVDEVRSRVGHQTFVPGQRILDFGCGTGIVTELVAPYVAGDSDCQTELLGIDILKDFLAKFDARAAKVNAEYGPSVTMHSVLLDVLDPDQEELCSKFIGTIDVIYSTLSFHHIHNYKEITKKLATFLRPGGWLYIIDFYNEDVEKDVIPSNNSVRHMGGLKKEVLNATLGEYAGLVNVSSAREARISFWQSASFVENHLTVDITDKLHSGKLPTKQSNGETLYQVEASLILASGQKPIK